jgi:hypothetical protein
MIMGSASRDGRNERDLIARFESLVVAKELAVARQANARTCRGYFRMAFQQLGPENVG